MRKYKGLILKISKLLLSSIFLGLGVRLIMYYTPLAKLADSYLIILAIILPFVFKSTIMIRKNSLFAEYIEIFDSDYKSFNKTFMTILIIEYFIIMCFVKVLNNVLGLYETEYEGWKYEGTWFFAITMFIGILFCGSIKNRISLEDLDSYDSTYEYLEDNKLIIKKNTKRIIRNAIIAAIIISITYSKIIYSRVDFIFDRISWTKTEKEIVEYFEKKYNIHFEIEKTEYDKDIHAYTHTLKTRDNRTFNVKQVLKEDSRTLDSFHYELRYSLSNLYIDELTQIIKDLKQILVPYYSDEYKYADHGIGGWDIDDEINNYRIRIYAPYFDNVEQVAQTIMKFEAYYRENIELFCMCNQFNICLTGINYREINFIVKKDKPMFLQNKYYTKDNIGAESTVEIKDAKHLEELIKFKNFSYLLKRNKLQNNKESDDHVFISDVEKKMFLSDLEKYKELYGE